jgi:hypothetical protein
MEPNWKVNNGIPQDVKTSFVQQDEKALFGKQLYVDVQVVQFVWLVTDIISPKTNSGGVPINKVVQPVKPSDSM